MNSIPKSLEKNLTPGEEVACCVQTYALVHPTYVAVTNKRVIRLDTKVLGRYDFSDIPHSKISYVVGKKGAITGKLEIESESEDNSFSVSYIKNHHILEVIESMKNEINKVAIEPISIKRKKGILGEEWTFSKPPETLVRGVNTPAPHAMQEIDRPKSNIDQIREYKLLMDEGIISQEEFEIKKRELLNL